MFLKKLVSVANVGRLKAYNALGGDSDFKRCTLIYGENGQGKTTLCAILRSLHTGNPDYIKGRKTLGVEQLPKVKLLPETGSPIEFADNAWSTNLPNLMIFDQDFIAENVHAGDFVGPEQRRNLYKVILGSEGVALTRELDTAIAAVKAVTDEIRPKSNTLAAAVGIQSTALDGFLRLPENPQIDNSIAAAERELLAAQESTQLRDRPNLEAISIPAFPDNVPAILQLTLEDVSGSAEQKVKNHIAAHGMRTGGQAWIETGLGYDLSSGCPFCAQDITGNDLISAFRTLFSSEYKALKESIIGLGQDVATSFDAAKVAVTRIVQANTNQREFWSRYCSLEELPVLHSDEINTELQAIQDLVLPILSSKAATPLERLEPGTDYAQARSRYDALATRISEYNTKVQESIAAVTARKASALASNIQAAQATLTNLKLQKKRHESPHKEQADELAILQASKPDKERARDAVKARLDTYSDGMLATYQDSINRLLRKFNAGFSIDETSHNYVGGSANAKYQISINEVVVPLGDTSTGLDTPCFKNTLSAGDKSTLALAFFLAQASADPEIANKILVFDDPFNSQDNFRRNQTAQEIAKLGMACKQTLVLSHSLEFLKDVQDKMRDTPIKAFEIKSLPNKTVLATFNLDERLRSDHAKNIYLLQAFLSDPSSVPSIAEVAKIIRPTLEGFCKHIDPIGLAHAENLGGILQVIREQNGQHELQDLYEELAEINDYCSPFHHTNPSGVIQEVELRGFVDRTMQVVRLRVIQ